jgi:formylmethanofuran dehydrogenase subunit E
MDGVEKLLRQIEARHRHRCPRQVLGARIALAGAAALNLSIPRADRRLIVFVESDGCFADAVEVVTGATVGRRTLRVMDYGLVAATFVDARTEAAVRVSPQSDVRVRALAYAPEETGRYRAQLLGYARMPDEALLAVRPVVLKPTLAQVLSRAGRRVTCARCGEEIHNEREIMAGDRRLCAACAGLGYYDATDG